MKREIRTRFSPLMIMGFLLIFTNNCSKNNDGNENENFSMKDGDGNVYTSVVIGTQEWLKENLKTTKYNDGTSIPNVIDPTAWYNLSTPGYCWYNNDASANKNVYGALYNWYVVNTGKLCPTGWHVPADSEWTILSNYLGGEYVAGGKLKENGTTHWLDPNTGATNESDFTALPSGDRVYNGEFYGIGEYCYWWSSTEISSSSIIVTNIGFHTGYTEQTDAVKVCGFSVRCVRD